MKAAVAAAEQEAAEAVPGDRVMAKTAPKPRVVRVNSKGRGAAWRPPSGGSVATAETKAGVASLFGMPQQPLAAAADHGEV